MITPTHIAINFATLFAVVKLDYVDIQMNDVILLLSSEFVDIDHLFSKPIYHPRRNPFKTHFLHKRWILIVVIAIFYYFIDLCYFWE